MWWIIGGIGAYSVAAAFFFWLNNRGPVSPGLALLRGALWPLWLAGGIQGQRERMD